MISVMLCAVFRSASEVVITYLSCHFVSGGLALECKVLAVAEMGLDVFFHSIHIGRQ
jgi:hypothetical protein